MTSTVGVLLGCALDDVDAAARGLLADAQSVDGIGGRVPELASAWSGPAAGAATGRLDELQSFLAAIGGTVASFAQVLLAAVTGLRPARDALARAVRCAADAGLELSADGRVVPPSVAAAATGPGAEVSALARAALAAAAAVDADAALALVRAGEPLRAAARRVCSPSLPAGPAWQWSAPLSVAPWPFASALFAAAGPAAGWLPGAIPTDASPLDVAAWWAVQPAAARAALVAGRPDRIGNLDGLPVQVRHDANVAVLAREQLAGEEVLREHSMTGPDRGRAAAAACRLAMLYSVRRALLADPARRLVTLDFSDGGLAAVAVGDVDSAADVAVVVPGLNQSVTGDLGNVVADADYLRTAATVLAGVVAPGAAVATIAWIGYPTPTFATVMSDHRARVGGRRLASFASGLDGARAIERLGPAPPAPLHMTAVGYSYGSTAVGYAMRRRPPLDDVVLLGSPGAGADTAGEIDPGGGHVFVGEAKDDPVADLSWFGADPSSRHFGARLLQTDAGTDPLTGAPLGASRGHFEYFDPGSESLRNIAAVTIGAPQLATYGDMSGSGDDFFRGIDLLIR